MRNYKKIAESENIKQIIQDRKIKKLLHFTRQENIKHIEKHGILSVKKLKEKNIPFKCNDLERWDGLPNFISVSISKINHYLLRQFQQRNEMAKWFLIELSPDFITSKKCYFFNSNAANSKFKNIPKNQLSTPEAFEGMFSNQILYKDRIFTRNGIKKNQPTDIQAEICVEEHIEPKYFKKIGPLTGKGVEMLKLEDLPPTHILKPLEPDFIKGEWVD